LKRPSPKLLWASVLATVFVVAHIAFLPSTLEDIDSLNFALGLHEFDPARHQPHPPGYPIFIALARLARLAMPTDAKALALVGALFGALAVLPMLGLFENLERLEQLPRGFRMSGTAALAVIVAVTSPLYWFNALRPLSDIPGLAITLAAQAALVAAYTRQRMDPSRTPAALEASGRMIVLGAFLSAIAVGFRSQAAVLTLPLLLLVLLQRAGRGAAGALLGSAMTYAIGTLLWAVPLTVASGGISRYRAALASQGGEDFSGVDMLYRNPTPRRLAIGLLDTFIRPWASMPLGWVVFVLAFVGFVALLLRGRRTAIALVVLAGPYAVFHLLFQETLTTRYALPLIPVVAYLAVRGLQAVRAEFGGASVTAITCSSLLVTFPATQAYARDGSPAFAAIADLHRLLQRDPNAAIGTHQGILRSLQTQNFGQAKVLKAPPMREWLELAAYWREGGTEPVWFFQDPARTDTELIDPLSRSVQRHYVWSFQRQDFMSGVRPDVVDLVRIDSPPGWFGEDGWHLTSETLNMSERLRKHEAVAYVRTRPEPALVVIGGESTIAPSAAEPASQLSMTLDGRVIDSWTVSPGRTFLRSLELPAGALAGLAPALKRLVVSYATPDGSPEPVRLTQFALEDAAALFFVQHTGWNEIEYSRELQRRWRWTTDRAVTFINPTGRDVTLTIAGENPLKYFDSPPHIAVRAGDQVLATAAPSADFDLAIKIPADALAAARGMVTIETDRTFIPHDRSGVADRRRLGLRIFTFEVR